MTAIYTILTAISFVVFFVSFTLLINGGGAWPWNAGFHDRVIAALLAAASATSALLAVWFATLANFNI